MTSLNTQGVRLRLRGGWVLHVWPRQIEAGRTLALWSYGGKLARIVPAGFA